jgi:hypothetical protein
MCLSFCPIETLENLCINLGGKWCLKILIKLIHISILGRAKQVNIYISTLYRNIQEFIWTSEMKIELKRRNLWDKTCFGKTEWLNLNACIHCCLTWKIIVFETRKVKCYIINIFTEIIVYISGISNGNLSKKFGIFCTSAANYTNDSATDKVSVVLWYNQ